VTYKREGSVPYDGLTLDLDRIRTWGCTGVALPRSRAKYHFRPEATATRERRELSRQRFRCTFTSGRRKCTEMPRQVDPARNAVHQMVIASAALAAAKQSPTSYWRRWGSNLPIRFTSLARRRRTTAGDLSPGSQSRAAAVIKLPKTSGSGLSVR